MNKELLEEAKHKRCWFYPEDIKEIYFPTGIEDSYVMHIRLKNGQVIRLTYDQNGRIDKI